MTPQQFAQTIRTKFPNGVTSDGIPYTEMDDQELTRRIVDKYPVYEAQIELRTDTSGESNPVEELASGVGNAFRERAGNIGEEVSTSMEEKRFGPRRQLRVAGEAAGLAGDIGSEAIKFLAPQFVEDLASRGMEKVGETEVAQAFAEKYAELEEKHPEAMKDIGAVINIAGIVPTAKGAQIAGKGISQASRRVSRVTGEALDARRVARVESAKSEIDSVVGNIVQGKKGDIQRAKKALSSLDTTGVKTYSDLRTKIDDGVEALARKVDEKLEVSGEGIGLLKADNLATKTRVGSTSVNQNFVEDAIEQLDELYTKTKDAPEQARITNLRNKLSEEGLTLREVNDLAREYGREFGKKGFSKRSGEPLTSVNAQAYENTRKGIKNAVRNKMPDDVTKMLDERMSEMLSTKRLITKMDEKVNSLYQRVKKRGVMEKIARGAADVVNAATFGTLSSFVARMLPSNVGLKVMNSIDLEDALRKNLKKFDKLSKITSDDKFADEVTKLLKQN